MKIRVDSDADLTVTLPNIPKRAKITIIKKGKGILTLQQALNITTPLQDIENDKWRQIANILYYSLERIDELGPLTGTEAQVANWIRKMNDIAISRHIVARQGLGGLEFKTIDYDQDETL